MPMRRMPVLLALLAALAPLYVPSKAQEAQEVQILGFTDVNYLFTEQEIADGFALGQMVGHVAAGLSERLAFFGEVSATARSAMFQIEVERVILRYTFADFLKVSAGRYHTPVSYWNTAFHHGFWLQTTTARPELIKFGSRFLPVHFVGLLAEGTFPTTRLGLGYTAGIGNGRHELIARAGDAGDVNDHRAWLLGLQVRPVMLFGLQAGVSFYRDRIEAGPGASVDERIYAAHLAWEKEQPEFIAEYARVVHDPAQGAAERTANNGYYVQLAYRLPGRMRVLKPYVRLERLDTAAADPVFAPLALDYEGAIVGLRYDFAALAALKGEYRNERFEDSTRFHSLYLQVSFTFPGLATGH